VYCKDGKDCDQLAKKLEDAWSCHEGLKAGDRHHRLKRWLEGDYPVICVPVTTVFDVKENISVK
jgi:superfamily II DNA helicase RecQ